MDEKGLNSKELYKLAYDAHYNYRRYDVAYTLYNKVIEEYPGTDEAKYASQQLSNIMRECPSVTPNNDDANIAIDTGVIIPAPVERNTVSDPEKEEVPEKTMITSVKVKDNPSGSIWISGMKFVAWIMFFGMIIAGIILAVATESGGLGFLIFVAAVIIAFLSVAMLMIFLDLAKNISKMARDVSEIKKIISLKA